jgi:beta-1,4-mannosyltransferase
MGIIILSPKTIYTELLIKSLKMKRVSYFSLTPLKLISSLLTLIKLRLKNFRLIHIQWIPTNSILLFLGFIILLKILRFKIIWTMHNILPHEIRRYSRCISCRLYKWSDRVILASVHNLEPLKMNLKVTDLEKIRYIPLGEISAYFPNLISLEAARRMLKIPMDKKVFLYLGTIRRYKGVRNFLLALKEFINQSEEVIGMVVGKPVDYQLKDEVEEFKKELGERLILNFNYVPNQEIQNYLMACDVCVLPYERITNSLSIFLPYAFARPVISIAAGNILDVVKDGETGILIRDVGPKTLVQAMNRILKFDYKKMGERGRTFTQQNFSWGKIGTQTFDLYREINRNQPLEELVLFHWGKIE